MFKFNKKTFLLALFAVFGVSNFNVQAVDLQLKDFLRGEELLQDLLLKEDDLASSRKQIAHAMAATMFYAASNPFLPEISQASLNELDFFEKYIIQCSAEETSQIQKASLQAILIGKISVEKAFDLSVGDNFLVRQDAFLNVFSYGALQFEKNLFFFPICDSGKSSYHKALGLHLKKRLKATKSFLEEQIKTCKEFLTVDNISIIEFLAKKLLGGETVTAEFLKQQYDFEAKYFGSVQQVQDKRKTIAIHEAGHAVVAALQGLEIESASIESGGESIEVGGKQCATLGLVKIKESYSVDREKAILFLIGGPMAEKIKHKLNPDLLLKKSWLGDARSLLVFAYESFSEKNFVNHTNFVKELIYKKEEECRKLLEKNFDKVEAVAAALLDKKTLTDDEVKAIVFPCFDRIVGNALLKPRQLRKSDAGVGSETGKAAYLQRMQKRM